MSGGSAFVHGAAVSRTWCDSRRSLGELIFDTVQCALGDARLNIGVIDSVVLASHDIVDGRSLSSMVTSPAAGAYLRDEIRLADDGLVAASLAAARIEAGESACSIVAAWGRASEGNYQKTSKTAFDPFTEQALGMDEFAVSALRLSAWLQRHGDRPEERTGAIHARISRARTNPGAFRSDVADKPVLHFPLRDVEGPHYADVVVAMILSAKPSTVRIAGCGHSCEAPQIGERDLVQMTSLRQAFGQASARAGVGIDALSLCELAGTTLTDEVMAMEALGLAAPGDGFKTYVSSNWVNASGAGASGWCYPAMGLVNLAECQARLKALVASSSMKIRRRHALVTGQSPVGAQSHSAMILETV